MDLKMVETVNVIKKACSDAPTLLLMLILMPIIIGFGLRNAAAERREREYAAAHPRREHVRFSDGTETWCTQVTRGSAGLDFAGCDDGKFHLAQTNVVIYEASR